MNTPPRFAQSLLWCAYAGLAMGAVGCAGSSPHALATHQPGVAGEYKQVYLTGSHIPVRVPTSPTARPLPTMSPLIIVTGEDIGRVLGRTGTH